MERQKAGLPAVAVQLPIIAQGGYAADGSETKAVSLTSNKCFYEAAMQGNRKVFAVRFCVAEVMPRSRCPELPDGLLQAQWPYTREHSM